ncbi:MAG: hypothetical protein DI598_06415 [Pseudopedobacter saltans]|uniref:Uncharacterized protein n=1 Tax=Pseudopedobacter saltans TaxID=151895 RepID=A0A2W5F1G7_9SPHI|nr:MAG: hypothetical protein DI598_06415 [Pseudopedobacter saltans]
MKKSSSIILAFVLLLVIAAVYRIIPGRPGGFAPQYSMAVFGGAIFLKDKKWAFLLPIGSLFISDVIYQILFKANLTTMPGFYSGQLVNYAIFASVTFFGFLLKKQNVLNIAVVSILAATYYFVVSNFAVWAMTDYYPHTYIGLTACYEAAIPFYKYSLYASLVFSALLFGGYALLEKYKLKSEQVTI